MKLKSAILGSLLGVLLSAPGVFADAMVALNEGMNQLGAMVFAFLFLFAIVMFVAVYISAKLKKPGFRNIIIGIGLLLMLITFANAFTGGMISQYVPGLFGVVASAGAGIMLVILAIAGAEYAEEKSIWGSEEKSDLAVIRSIGKKEATPQLTQEAQVLEDVFAQLRALIKKYRAALKGELKTFEDRKEAADIAKRIIKVLELQEEALQLEAATLLMAEVGGEEALKDKELTTPLNTTLDKLTKRLQFILKESQEHIDAILGMEERELKDEAIEIHARGKSAQEAAEIRKLYALHKESIPTLRQLRTEILTEENINNYQKQFEQRIEAIKKQNELRQQTIAKTDEKREEKNLNSNATVTLSP